MKFVAFLCAFSLVLLNAEGMTYDHKLTLKDNVCELSYTYNSSADTFHFKLKVYSTGWVALALTLEEGGKGMKNYDIALGGVNAMNTTYLNDYWSPQVTRPTLDTKQDFMLVSGTEMNGWTTLEFYRKADTKDTNNQDIKIEKGKAVYFAWALNNQDATSSTSFAKHTNRGHTTVGYDMFTGKEVSDAGSYLVASVALVAITTVFQYLI